MNQQLVAVCQMFLVPVSVLFTALGVARTEALKSGISAIGLVISLVWVFRIWIWEGISFNDWITALLLALVFLIASVVSIWVHCFAWQQERQAPPRPIVDSD